MRIVIDMQGAQGGSRERGIGRYTRSMVREFLRENQGDEIFLLFNGVLPAQQELMDEFSGLFKPENVRVWYAEAPFDSYKAANATRRELAELIWESAVRALRPDFLLIFSMFEGWTDNAVATSIPGRDFGVAAIMYDLIPMRFHELYLSDGNLRVYYERQIRHLKECDLLLTISDSSARDAQRLLKFPRERLVTIGTAVDEDFADRSMPTADRVEGLNRPYLLYVSGGDERKNQKGLISAFSKIPDETRCRYQIVIAGALPNSVLAACRQFARSLDLADDEIVFAPYVTDAQLHRLYMECFACVFPSWYEGFGLPILEAMAFGKAVIGSDYSSITEIIRNKNALFDPHNEEEIATAIYRLMTDDDFRNELEGQAAEIFRSFSWTDVARRAREAIGECNIAVNSTRAEVARLISAVRSSTIMNSVSPDAIGGHLASTFRPDPRRQLLLDISVLVGLDSRTGVQRVVRSVLNSLLNNPPEGWLIEAIYAKPGKTGYYYAREFSDKLFGLNSPWHRDEPVRVWPGDVFCGLDLSHQALVEQKQLLTDWRRKGVKVWTVVYDILPLLLPQFFWEELSTKHREWVCCLAQFDGAICISKAVADELLQWIEHEQIPTSRHFRAEWFHLGGDILGNVPSRGVPEDALTILDCLSQRPSILMVGTVEPRKGYGQTLAAFEHLWGAGSDVNLVIVGKKGWHVEELAKRLRNHPEAGKRLFWLEGISDEFLDQVYEACDVLLAASEGEGFGLPLIEAAQKGIPLLVRDLPVFREVAGSAADYFANTTDPAAIVAAMEKWLAERGKPAAGPSAQLTWLTWDESTVQLFERITQ